jgi:hypothetical protein
VEGFAARSFGLESKQQLQGWIVTTYSTDQMTELPPVTEDRELLSFDQACRKAAQALGRGTPVVLFPLRAEGRKVTAYRVLKESAFVFETPEQRLAVLRQMHQFEKRTGAGLELLCLRRAYGGRRRHSLEDLAEELYRLIRGHGVNLGKQLNLGRLSGHLNELATLRVTEIRDRKARAEEALLARMDARGLAPAFLVTAYLLRPAEAA